MSWCRRVGSSRRGRWARAVVGAVVVGGALVACASPGEPPVVALGPSAADPPTPGGTVRAEAPGAGGVAGAEGPVHAHEPVGAGAPAAGRGVDAADREVCDLVRDADVMTDVDGWVDYHGAIEDAVPGGADLVSDLVGLTAETTMTPTVTAAMDALFDALKDHCGVDPRAARCHDVVMAGMADPLGWLVRADGPAEVERAFALARRNWVDLRDRAEGDDLRAAADAHLAFLDGATSALGRVGWEPGRLDVLEPLDAELVALGGPAVIEPLAELEASCGLR